ncbi:metallopeptidase family protein [Citricoccus sp.]|uniref:metallopeptidase family protein n=1 Tax=Citricoccus sp. TaxID=1978372 RepID=UPI0028BE895D|nr:metallopeptidase family protein [Citricoccus sp.]
MTSFEPVAVEHGVARGMGQDSGAPRTPSTSGPASGLSSPSPRRDRRGRGLRGPLMPPGLPGARSRNEAFSDHLAAAVSRLAEVCGPAVEQARFRMTMVPEDLESRLELVRAWGAELVDDPTGSMRRDAQGTAVITIHRRPLEARCPAPSLLPDLVYGAVVEQWAELTGLAPEAVDPDFHW